MHIILKYQLYQQSLKRNMIKIKIGKLKLWIMIQELNQKYIHKKIFTLRPVKNFEFQS